ncbi:MAG: hypothetical protein R3C42_06420 [Parvularculaceae bacterium]
MLALRVFQSQPKSKEAPKQLFADPLSFALFARLAEDLYALMPDTPEHAPELTSELTMRRKSAASAIRDRARPVRFVAVVFVVILKAQAVMSGSRLMSGPTKTKRRL